MVESAHEDGAHRRGQRDAGPGQGAGGQRDGDDVVARRPGQVLDHLAVAGVGQPDERRRRPRGSLEARMTSADSMATSVPAPMAMPTSAPARAGASLTPSPTMATDQAAGLQLGDLGVLVLGEDLGHDLVDAELAADGSATWRASPVIITTRLPRRRSSATASLASGRISSSRASAPTISSPSDEVENGRAALLPLLGTAAAALGLGERPLPQQGRPADGVALAVDGRLDAPAGDRAEPGGAGDAVAALLGRGHDRPGQRVLAVGFHAAGQPQHLVVVEPDAGDAGDGMLALGQRAGLVEEDGVDGAHPLQGQPVLDQDAGPGREATSRSR